MAKAKAQGKMIANNKKAYHDYFILDTYEAGIALAGTEVKSLRMGKCSIKESFIRIEDGEVFIYGMHITHTKREIFSIKILACEKAPSSQIGDQQTDRQDQGKRNGDRATEGVFQQESCQGRDRTGKR